MTITVHYPFHPLHGLEFTVVCKPRQGEGILTIVDQKGIRLSIPSWMTHPQASQYKISDHAEVSPRALLSLADLIASIPTK